MEKLETPFDKSTKFDWTPGRWAISSHEEYEGLFPETFATKEEAIAAAPEIMRQNNYGDEEHFFVTELIQVPLMIPADLEVAVLKTIHESTFKNWEEPPEFEISEDLRIELRLALRHAISTWRGRKELVRDIAQHSEFEIHLIPKV